MERHMRLSRAAVVLVAIALIAAIAAAVWFASPDAPYVPSEDSGAALGTAAPAEDGTVAGGYQPSGKGISEGADTPNSAITTIRNSGNGSYYLTSNIVVNSLTDCVFSGTLDGNGKTIYIRYDSGETEDPNVDPTYVGIGALFGNLNGATIKNVKIVVETFRYVEGSAGTRNVGIIAGDAWGGVTIENVYVALQYSPTSNGRSYFLDSGAHEGGVWSGTTSVELNFGAVLGKSGASDSSPTDVTLKNVTVDNQTSGNYGFSAWVRHNDYCNYKVSMGHFVGWVTGELLMQNCTLRGGESAKMTIERGGSGGSTTNQSGAVIGRLDEQSGSKPSLTIAGLDMEMAINFGTYKVMNIDIGGNNGIIYGNDANNAYTVSVSDIFWNENSGDPGWYDGDDQNQITYNNLTKYDPNTIGVSFDNDQIVLSAMSQYIDKAELNSITFNKVTYSVWDKLIATDTKAVGQWTQVVTVAKPKSKTGGNITFTEMGTGTFTIEGGETITGVSGNSYTAEREYDGTVPQSPSVVLSSGGGSYADVWKATNASANVGQYTMTFDKSVLTAAGSVVEAGSDGLTYIAKNGIVYSPESIDPVGRLNIANDINVTVTKAPVEVVVANIPGTFYDGDPMPKLTVQSVTPNVPGKIAWDDSSLVYGKNEYGWTWTPEDDNNYQPDTGTVMLEVLQATIDEIVVSGDFETQYTAYDAFNPDGMVVTAYYDSDPEHERGVVLESSDYTVSVENGNTDRLIVANNTVTVSLKEDTGVSTKISIIVSKLAVGIPKAIQGLVYNGGEQKGVAEGEHYMLSVDAAATDAGDYVATARLTYPENTRWNTADPDDTTPKEIPWTIAQMTLDGTVLAAGSLEYDGKEKEAAFNLTVGKLFGSDQVEVVYGVTDDRVNVTDDGFTATAQLPSSGNYKWATDAPSASFTVTPKPVVIGVTGDLSKTYDGHAVDPDELFTAPQGVGGGALVLTVTVDGGVTILNAGSYTVTAVLAQGQPNYTAKQAVAKYSVSKADPTVNPTADVQGALYTSDDLYEIALNLGEQDTPGTVSWDEGQRLTADEQEYRWTFVPTDEVNYNGKTGVIRLTAEQAQLVSVTVDVMPDTVYTAFDAFDPEGMVVTAHYQNGDTKQVALNDLSLTVDQGSINRLVVASTTVTVSYSDGGVTMSATVRIEVLPLEVAAPKAKSNLVYNGEEQTGVEEGEHYTLSGVAAATNAGDYVATATLTDKANTVWEDGSTDDVSIAWTISEPVTSDEVIADILAMEKVTWQNAEEFLDLEARYNALDKSEQTADATAKLEVLRAQYDALRNAAFDDIEAAHEVTAKSLGKALAAAAAGLSAAAIALAIAKRRSI